LTYLARTYRHSSELEWRNRLQNGGVFLNGREVGPDTVLDRGQWLIWRRPPWLEPDVPLAYAVLYEDEELLAVAKPGGLPTAPGGGFLEHTLLRLVRKHYPEAAPIHRLGRGTSGIVLFARTARARSVLCEAMRRNEVIKIYRALANGIPARDSFFIDTPIGPVPHPKLGTIHAACQDGRYAVSRVSVLERRADASLLEVRIETGRPHQIRIHLAAAGHPLTGDPLYASGGGINESGTALPGDLGYLLHAERICLRHPATGAVVEIWCSPPPELRIMSEMKG
jgi:23S rRNA pseudouridine1911/1915/1917 synthase